MNSGCSPGSPTCATPQDIRRIHLRVANALCCPERGHPPAAAQNAAHEEARRAKGHATEAHGCRRHLEPGQLHQHLAKPPISLYSPTGRPTASSSRTAAPPRRGSDPEHEQPPQHDRSRAVRYAPTPRPPPPPSLLPGPGDQAKAPIPALSGGKVPPGPRTLAAQHRAHLHHPATFELSGLHKTRRRLNGSVDSDGAVVVRGCMRLVGAWAGARWLERVGGRHPRPRARTRIARVGCRARY